MRNAQSLCFVSHSVSLCPRDYSIAPQSENESCIEDKGQKMICMTAAADPISPPQSQWQDSVPLEKDLWHFQLRVYGLCLLLANFNHVQSPRRHLVWEGKQEFGEINYPRPSMYQSQHFWATTIWVLDTSLLLGCPWIASCNTITGDGEYSGEYSITASALNGKQALQYVSTHSNFSVINLQSQRRR